MIPDTYQKYGPGKYSNNVEEAIHEITMDNGDGFGDVETFGFYSLVVFDAEERAALLKVDYGASAAALVEEDSQGFVSFRFFATEAEARAVYDTLSDEWADAEAEAEAEAERDRFVPGRDAFRAGE